MIITTSKMTSLYAYDHLSQKALIMMTTSTGAYTLKVQLPLPLSGTRNS
jgi:hypothetical protein